ncbi:hypothetical protein CH341_03115 [Rhodoplanes roseus]|uniref:Uncharacterized protein n=1 Tax=Rhodoplanes roseus TaxID=29409 RepID=A0A327L626_9BRAD|nr:hypothetical protein CH341_03115 [Rhodoplanes roseus]
MEPKPAEPPKEAIVAADEDKPAAEKPKRTKKVRKKTRTETGQAPWGGDYRRAEAYPRQGYGPGWGPRPGGFFPY